MDLEIAVWQTLVIAVTIFASVMIYYGQPIVYVLYGVADDRYRDAYPGQGTMLQWMRLDPCDNANGIGELLISIRMPEKLWILSMQQVTHKGHYKRCGNWFCSNCSRGIIGSFITDVSKVQIQLGLIISSAD